MEKTDNQTRFAALLVVLVALAGVAGYHLGSKLSINADWQDLLWKQLAVMGVVAALIERSVEVYLDATGKNGDSRFGERTARPGAPPAQQSAAVAGLVLGTMVALSGLTLLAPIAALDGTGAAAGANGTGASQSPSWWAGVLFRGADVAISAGLLAGGAALFHELAETIRGGLRTLSLRAGPTPAAQAAPATPTPAPAPAPVPAPAPAAAPALPQS